MLQHHADCVENLRHHFDDDPEVLAVILGGSVAKGTEKPTSDIDGVVVVTPEQRERLRQAHRLAGVITGVCDYEGAMFDLKYVTVDWLRAAAERGSEPTRNSFLKSRVLAIYDRDHPDAREPELSDADVLQRVLDRIGRYPVEEKADRLHSFYAAYYLNKGYFWPESFKRPNPFLLSRTASEIVLYGLRMILAQNEVLFPCMKCLMSAVEGCPDRPYVAEW
ncbi:MAG: nucleotidyltransferase domain-containing protein [Spirochaetota bacterium]